MRKCTLLLFSSMLTIIVFVVPIAGMNAQTEGEYKVYLPITERPTVQIDPPPPKPTTLSSFYINDTADTYSLGCELGISALGKSYDGRGLTILHFGIPSYQNGFYGVRTYSFPSTFRTTDEIKSAIIAFVDGYMSCGVVSPPYPTTLLAPPIWLGIGLHNQEDVSVIETVVGTAHGQEWAYLVDEVGELLLQTQIAGHVYAVGAIDLEPEFNAPEPSIAWVEGFWSAFLPPDSLFERYLFNFGTAGGCGVTEIPEGYPSELVLCGAGEFDSWRMTDLLEVTVGHANLRVVPQIYRNDGFDATKWYRTTLHAIREGEPTPTFRGVLTTYGACLQLYNPETGTYEDDNCDPNLVPVPINNTADEGWSFFVDTFYQQELTAIHLANNFRYSRYSTDIRYQE